MRARSRRSMVTSASAVSSPPRPRGRTPEEPPMDVFHDNPMLQGVRQMLGAFAKQMMRPIAIKHDQEESMPWDLLKPAQSVGLSQTAVLDGRRRLTGIEEDPDPKKPKTQARI